MNQEEAQSPRVEEENVSSTRFVPDAEWTLGYRG